MALLVGGLFVALGLLANKWVLEFLFSNDGQIDTKEVVLLIWIFQIICISIGLYISIIKPKLQYKNFLLILFSTIFSITILEIGFRIYVNYLAPAERSVYYKLVTEIASDNLTWAPHHYLNYYPNPNYQKGGTSHNSLGYRGGEFSADKPMGTFRIVALGGSTTYTIAVEDNEKTFTQQLENILRDGFGYKNVEVINAGVGGYNSWESLINLQFRVLDLSPDLVLIYHGTNDVHSRLVLPSSYLGDNSGRRRQWSEPPISLFFKHIYLLRAISVHLNLDLFQGASLGSVVNASTYQGYGSLQQSVEPMLLLEKNQPVFFQRNLINMVAIARAHGVNVILSTWAHSPNFEDYASTPHYRVGFEENNRVVKNVARHNSVILFDLASKMPGDTKYWADGRHVNEYGARVKAELFADFIHGSGILTQSPEQNVDKLD